MAIWSEWINALGGEFYNSVFNADTNTTNTTHTFTTSMALEKGTYDVVIHNVRTYWYEGETLTISVENGTYTTLKTHTNIPAYGGFKTVILQVEMADDGNISVVGTGTRQQYTTIVAHTSSGGTASSSSVKNNNFHLDFYGGTNRTHLFLDENANISDYDISEKGGYLSSGCPILYPPCASHTTEITLTATYADINLSPYWLSSSGTMTRADAITLTKGTPYHFMITDFGDETCVGVGFYQYAVNSSYNITNDDKALSVDITTLASGSLTFDAYIDGDGEDKLTFEVSELIMEGYTHMTITPYNISNVRPLYIAGLGSYTTTDPIVIDLKATPLTTIAIGCSTSGSYCKAYISLKSDKSMIGDTKIKRYTPDTASTVVTNPTENTKKIMFEGKPKALYYALGRTETEGYIHYCYWDTSLQYTQSMNTNGNDTPVIEVGDNYIILDLSGYGTPAATVWNYFFSLITISE